MDKAIYTAEQGVLCELLRELRRSAGLRQVDVARALSEPQSFVSKYESGERRLDLIEIRQIAQVLGSTVLDLVIAFEKQLASIAPVVEGLAALDTNEPAGPVDDED